MKLVIFVVGGTLLISIGLIFGLPYLNQGGGVIEINPLEYDVGTVSMADGLVKKTFEIKNIGEEDLKIENIRTSCACTTAFFKIGDKVGPKFGMPGHGINPSFWSEKIGPGEKADLEVIFDPAFHGPQGAGSIIRAVYFSTSDPQNKEAEVRLIANVIP
jgi:hypothetical protein